ncbi:MAG: hypothetical protein ACK4TA_00045 [Saprospiraceae bacterium]
MAWGKPFLYSLLLALLGYALWFIELHYWIGGADFEWLSYAQYSIFVIAALVVLAYLLPLRLLADKPLNHLAKAGVELYFVVLAAYFLEKLILLTLFTQFYGFLDRDWLLVLQVLVLVMTSMSFYFITQRWLKPLRWQQTLVFLLALLLPYPLSLLTLRLLANPSGEFSFLEATRQGYPFFWIILLMGIAGIFAIQHFKKGVVTATSEDILDDLGDEE